jgi:hypothetical protein
MASADCWSGPAGTVAATALVELSTVASGARTALDAVQIRLTSLVGDAEEAQALAAAALATAAAGGVGLDPAGRPLPYLARSSPVMAPDQRDALAVRQFAALRVDSLADAAFAAAARVLTTALTAGDDVGHLAGVHVPGAIGFDDLIDWLAPVIAPGIPLDRAPEAVAGWWSRLSAGQQQALVAADPAAVGALDGLPGWARDLANRQVLASALIRLPPDGAAHAMAAAVAVEIAEQEELGRPVQLLQFQPAGDLVSLAVGDVDTAGAVAVMVPGIFTTPAGDLPHLVRDARGVAAAAVAAAPGLAVATVVWLGYRTPASVFTAPSSRSAQRGGPALDRALDGLAAARAAPGGPPAPRTTVLAHSYGTLVASRAAQAPGRLAADALVLLGSPGTEALTVRSLEAGEVYGAWTPADPVSICDWFGSSPADPWFGDIELPTELTQGHTQYYETDRPTLAALGEVVAGTRNPQ